VYRKESLSEILKNKKYGEDKTIELIKNLPILDTAANNEFKVTNWDDAITKLQAVFDAALSVCLQQTEDKQLIANIVYALGAWGGNLALPALRALSTDDRVLYWKTHGYTFFEQDDKQLGIVSNMSYSLMFDGQYDSDIEKITISKFAQDAIYNINLRESQNKVNRECMSFWRTTVEPDNTPPSPGMYGGVFATAMQNITGDFYNNTMESMVGLFWGKVIQYIQGTERSNFFSAKKSQFRFHNFISLHSTHDPVWKVKQINPDFYNFSD
jgi:hypothetical protein